jgi:uncharacterized protein (DUF2336 family)
MRLGSLAKLFGRGRLPERLRYEEAREILESHSASMKRELASREDAPPETLYYMAGDEDPEVRTLVASNRSTPVQANELLQGDECDEVRAELARKIARILPDMEEEEQRALRERCIALLERLARDELPRVRAIVAEEVAHCTTIPKRLIARLAQDSELAVCGPVLQYSPLLSGENLIEIIATTRIEGAIAAIARRKNLDEDVSDAVVASLDVSAVAQLLANPEAKLREETLEKIISQAAGIEDWHGPLVIRPELSARAIKRIATFVSRALIDELARTHQLNEETQIFLKARAKERIEKEDNSEKTQQDAIVIIQEAHARRALTDEVVTSAASLHQTRAVTLALSLLSGVDENVIQHVIGTKSGRGITALCWKAGLSMRTALAIQTFVAIVPREELMLPRQGIDYPLDVEEMRWYLHYFGAIESLN